MSASSLRETADVHVQHQCTDCRHPDPVKGVSKEKKKRGGGIWKNGDINHSQPKQPKGKHGLVDPANHDPCAIVPVPDVAVIRQRAPHEVGQHAEPHGPDDGEDAVRREVVKRIQADEAVQEDRD